ncbi:alpha-ribazole phosphatase/probable phosphoglycerate mutase [Stackebrandtia albiflava]|uniref:Alpha-ribazole phosphatase/probable phosphoglycerate mutase n=1 Tax=Stackebrandtia albiflava TaxID=406432 RepID=A0A562V187_9ACTN|nr:histidine phosphatase family protein [Stackebrandtia albiflava]TWJ11680.1 alpha-ribazole phosphatase/probable phosphoglycerate mutase [Stackebrandtia albiflava]
MAVELTYETHSVTEDNENGIATGWLPGRLSERGRALAVELGERYRDAGLDAVYTSDLHRAVETARLAFPDTDLPVHRDARLRECDYGDLNGAPVTALAAVRSAHVDRPFPGGGQSYREVVDATRELLREIARDHDGGRVLVIAHSANRWALQALLTGARLEELVDAPFRWRPGWRYRFTADSLDAR